MKRNKYADALPGPAGRSAELTNFPAEMFPTDPMLPYADVTNAPRMYGDPGEGFDDPRYDVEEIGDMDEGIFGEVGDYGDEEDYDDVEEGGPRGKMRRQRRRVRRSGKQLNNRATWTNKKYTYILTVRGAGIQQAPHSLDDKLAVKFISEVQADIMSEQPNPTVVVPCPLVGPNYVGAFGPATARDFVTVWFTIGANALNHIAHTYITLTWTGTFVDAAALNAAYTLQMTKTPTVIGKYHPTEIVASKSQLSKIRAIAANPFTLTVAGLPAAGMAVNFIIPGYGDTSFEKMFRKLGYV